MSDHPNVSAHKRLTRLEAQLFLFSKEWSPSIDGSASLCHSQHWLQESTGRSLDNHCTPILPNLTYSVEAGPTMSWPVLVSSFSYPCVRQLTLTFSPFLPRLIASLVTSPVTRYVRQIVSTSMQEQTWHRENRIMLTSAR